jgi:hypothetical protein
MSIKPMHLAGALVLKEFIVFVRSRFPCVDQLAGRPVGSRLQVMGESVRPQHEGRLLRGDASTNVLYGLFQDYHARSR